MGGQGRFSIRYTIALTYNLKRDAEGRGTSLCDRDSEFDSPMTIETIVNGLRSYGHTVHLVEATAQLPQWLEAQWKSRRWVIVPDCGDGQATVCVWIAPGLHTQVSAEVVQPVHVAAGHWKSRVCVIWPE